jgi:hypothetical protein
MKERSEREAFAMASAAAHPMNAADEEVHDGAAFVSPPVRVDVAASSGDATSSAEELEEFPSGVALKVDGLSGAAGTGPPEGAKHPVKRKKPKIPVR